jgi:glycosyltransferase involved in cell wall biosynthesis
LTVLKRMRVGLSNKKHRSEVKGEHKKKLCLVIPSLQVGGMERVMSELAMYFCRKDDLEVHLILYGRKPEAFYSIPNNLTIHKPKSVFNNTFRFFASLGRMIYVRVKVKTINPDSVLSFGEYWNSFILLALFGLHYPVYISDRCSPEKKFSTFHTLIRKWLYPKAKGVIAQTEIAKQLYCNQLHIKNVHVIGNPIRQLRRNDTEIEKENIVLTIGRLIESKHHDQLIRLFAEIDMPGWKLIIVGDDAIGQKNLIKLKGLVHDLGMDEIIILTGNQPDVDSYYFKSKIFVFTSSSEGFPNVIGEAMSAGLPAIAFDCVAGPAEMITNKYDGLLVPTFNWDMFATSLKMLLKDHKLRVLYGENAAKSITRFSVTKIGQKYYDFIIGTEG